MKKMKSIISLFLIALSFNTFAQIETPAKKQTKKILLMNGIAHLGNGQLIENSVIAFEDGKLTLVANAKTIKLDMGRFDTVIQIEKKHVYPGIISPNSTIGITEIDAVKATRDYSELGMFKPHVRSIIAYNTESKITTTVRSNGVLMAQITPRGGRITGASSIVQFDAWNWEDALIKEDDGVHLNWTGMFRRGKVNKDYEKSIIQLNTFFANALAYSKDENYLEKNLRFEAMRGVFNGEKTLFIQANFIKEITEAINFSKKHNVAKMVIVGGYDAWMVTDMLKENNVSVILKRVHSLPERQEDDVNLPFKLPKMLHDAGVLFCLESYGNKKSTFLCRNGCSLRCRKRRCFTVNHSKYS